LKSIKPGRGPSFMGAIGSVIAVIFGIGWIGFADNMGAPTFFMIFGVLFIIMGIANVIYNLTNATSKNRFSTFDIVDGDEERDPLDPNKTKKKEQSGSLLDAFVYCPYCGARNKDNFEYCVKCGKSLPKIDE